MHDFVFSHRIVNLDSFANDFYSFYDFVEAFLEEYCQSLSKYFSWTILYRTIGTPIPWYEFINNDLEFEPYLEQRNSDLFKLFMARETVNLYYPIRVYVNMTSIICVKNTSAFLSALNLDKPEDFYNEYPLLIKMLGNIIEYIVREWIYFGYTPNPSEDYTDPDEKRHHYIVVKQLHERHNAYIKDLTLEYVTRYLSNKNLPSLSFFHSISDFSYEGNCNKGYIDFCKSIDATSDTIRFSNNLTVKGSDPKFLRKILEMSEKNNRLLVFKCDRNSKTYFESDWEIYGLGLSKTEIIATVHFMGSSKWQLYTNSELINYDGKGFSIRIRNTPEVATDLDVFEEFYRTICHWKKPYAKFLDLFKKIIDQKHGTMLVVSKKAKQEAERLCNANRGIKITPIDCSLLSQEKILQISKIDGAMLIDPNCKCYALGVILDGFVEPTFKGDSARGARYNSAKLYIHNIKSRIKNNVLNTYTQDYADHAMAIVISEDGYIDVFSSTEE